ncbi:MAG: glycoside hydrolase family 2 TIM barrel-domain containing protein [Candidatus Promineifilaceae bacterium]|nr:glycoside hydrolase family 2 TIM barrel-domain containing protein [Candidatus Promineifilaceae bacterium]
MRERISLDGPWEFHFDRGQQTAPDQLNPARWRTAQVPAPWQANFADLRDKSGVGWYRRRVTIPPSWRSNGQAVILHIGAADYATDVWCNGAHLGNHEGGYLPFQFNVGPHLQADNEILVRVVDPSDNPRRYPDFPFSEIPHGKQSWYGQTSGLWQPVWLECRPARHLLKPRLTPDLKSERIAVSAGLSKAAPEGAAWRITVADTQAETIVSEVHPIEPGSQELNATVVVPDPQPWSPQQPALYTVALHLLAADTVLDRVSDQCGFRTIETRDGHLYLNGQRFYMRGALDQDYYLETIYTSPSIEHLEDQFRKAKAMGLNTIRTHIKVADPRYLAAADRLGLLVWAEFPNFAYLSQKAAARARRTLAGMVERDWNHPSIVIWTIINEDWGTNLVENGDHRAWLREMYHWLKELDPSRLVVDNSPNRLSFHVESDLADYHFYQAHPDGRAKWDDFIERMAARDPALLYSPHGDAVIRGDEPLLVSEFGVWGLPDIDDIVQDGAEPYWMEYGLGFYEGVAYPHGVKDRFRRWHFDTHFGGWRPFVEATQWRQYYALKYQIETIRQRPQLDGYVITELTDVHWEVNGLMDMARNPRVFHQALAWLNADTFITPRSQRSAYWAGEEVAIDLILAHQQGATLADVVVEWGSPSGDVQGRVNAEPLSAGDVRLLPPATFSAPEVGEAVQDRFSLTVTAQGETVAHNHLILKFFPKRSGPRVAGARLWTPAPTVAAHLRGLGYELVDTLAQADLCVVEALTAETAAFGRAGGSVLILADHPDAVGSYFPRVDIFSPQMKPRRREGTPWSGYWVTSFSWLRRDGPFAGIPGEPFLDQSFERVIPDYVLEGFSPAEFEERVYAGIFVGWVNKMAALIGERRYGRGQVVLTTFRLLNDPPGADPIAASLLDGLIELALNKE